MPDMSCICDGAMGVGPADAGCCREGPGIFICAMDKVLRSASDNGGVGIPIACRTVLDRGGAESGGVGIDGDPSAVLIMSC